MRRNPYNYFAPLTSTFNNHLESGGFRAATAGTDFGMNIGTPLYAMEDGYGVGILDKSGALIFFLVSLDLSREWQYVHLDRFVGGSKVTKRSLYREGDLIGYSGETGFTFGPHLHLGLISNGVRIDSEQYLNNYFNNMDVQILEEIKALKNVVINLDKKVAKLYENTDAGILTVEFKDTTIQTTREHAGLDKVGKVMTRYFDTKTKAWSNWTYTSSAQGMPDLFITNDRIIQTTKAGDNAFWSRWSSDGKTWTDWIK